MCTDVCESTGVPELAVLLTLDDSDSDSADTEGAACNEFDRTALRLLVCEYVVASVLRPDTDLDVKSGRDLAVPSSVTVLDVV